MTAAILLAAAAVGQVTFATPKDAAGWAIAHQAEVPNPNSRYWYRYVWIPDWMTNERFNERHLAGALSYAVNEAASQVPVIIRPKRIANGWMCAVRLTDYASRDEWSSSGAKASQLQVLRDTWDGLVVNEPYFHEIKNNTGLNDPVIAAHLSTNGPVLAEHQGHKTLVYRLDWFITQLLHERYYKFAQFGRTRRDVYKAFGIDEKLAEKLNVDYRSANMISNVTGKPRRGDFVPGAVWSFQTWDVADESITVDRHPIYNALTFTPDGGEAIFLKPNGLHGYLLYNAEDVLLDEVPPNIAKDHTIPGPPGGPGSARLVPGISCIRCHAPGDGMLQFSNDIRKLVNSGTDILADLSDKDQRATIQRLAKLYMSDGFDVEITNARNRYDTAVRLATAGPGLNAGMGAQEAGECLSYLYGRYAHTLVDAAQACRELGHEPGDDAIETLNKILPRLPLENVVIGSLRAGIAVRRADWEQVYSAAMTEAGR